MKNIALLTVAACCLRAQSEGLGRIDFPTSGSPEAQEHFLRGVLFLHSFEYDDARQQFQIARKIAPGFAMAAWGEAMSYNEPIWFAQNRDSARAALKRLPQTPTEREKDYLQAVEVLYGEGSKEGRDVAYSEAMRRLFEKYPGDPEAASFYALSLLGACHRGRDFRVYMKAAAILEETLARNPEHPGALHYLIHCYDDPVHAPLGLRPARLYAKVAPQSAHALHMPAHIFVALGMWEEAVASNEASWAASEARVKRNRLPLEERGFHSLWWLEYGYLQQGRLADALRALSTVERDAKTSPSRLVRFHLAQMRATYMIETGQPYPASVDTADLDLAAVAADLLATGIVAANRGERAEAERSLSRLRNLKRETAPDQSGPKHNHVFAGDIQTIDIAEKELEATLLMADGKTSSAIEAMKKATAVEDSMSVEFGPPSPPKPAHELFGEILLQLGRAEEARRQFELALVRTPKRALSVLGLARALTQSGNAAGARQSYTELREIWRSADKDLRKALDETLP